MAAKKFICPEAGCGKSFTTRKLAKGHMAKDKHIGGVIVEEIEIVKSTTTTPGAARYSRKKGGAKGKKRKQMVAAYELYLKYAKVGRNETAIIKKIAMDLDVKENKVKGWLGTMKHEMKKKQSTGVKSTAVKDAKKDPEPEPEPEEPKEVYSVWLRLLPNIVEEISEGLTDGMIILENPENGNKILKYTNLQLEDYDWLTFYHNFIEIPLEFSDILFIINSEVSPHLNTRVYDLAQRKIYGVTDISDEGCIYFLYG